MPRSVSRVLFSLAFGLLFQAWGSIAAAQSTAAAQSQSAQPETNLLVSPATPARNVTGRWATMSVTGANRSDTDAVETAVVMLGDATNQQFAREFWIPAKAKRQSWLPVRIPEDIPMGQSQLTMSSIHLKQTDGGEAFQNNAVGMPTSTRSLLLSWESSRTGVLLEPSDPDQGTDERMDQLLRTIYAARDSLGVSNQDLGIVNFSGSFLPPVPKPLDPLDQLVIAGDQMLLDSSAVTQIRSWVHSGGRLWVMMDQIDFDAARALVDGLETFSPVDHVELNSLALRQSSQLAPSDEATVDEWTSEKPAKLLRCLVESGEVAYRVDGWPAAVWLPFGEGEILLTTLEANGWIHPDRPTTALQTLATRFFVARLEPVQPSLELATSLSDQIGYQIPQRSVIALVLGFHLLVLLGAGIVLMQRHALHHLAWLVPATGVLGTAALLWIGTRQTSVVPATIATAQVTQVLPGGSEGRVATVAAIYSGQSQMLELSASPQTTTRLPDLEASSEMRRLVWDDSGRSNWQFVSQPPGVVRQVRADSTALFPRPWMLRGTFGRDGFESRLIGLEGKQMDDGVIVALGRPTLAVDVNSESTAASGFDDVMSPDQFIDDTLLSDVQRRRQQHLRELMSDEPPLIGPTPTLLAWTDPLGGGVTIGGDFNRKGSMLAVVPVELERPSADTPFRVPASFVRLESVGSGSGTTSFFNSETGKWLAEMNQPTQTVLRCVPPSVLLPCRLSRAVMEIKIKAPSRQLEIQGRVDGEFVTLHRVSNPAGVLRFEIDQTDSLQLDADGGLVIAIAVSETAEQREAAEEELSAADEADSDESDDDRDTDPAPIRSPWQIDYLHVNLEGITL
ncbi:hypothetical protein FYK55_16760 [Roseiconus nitratireducens]|uniref:Uncharacterized protein n=1 Tax=Roseiconus nitratireducens TaxID=2605748 RepID=A0A5M6D3E4_9BACT|nr:hypothetical protein [Roseiconus nitratireducens]KAA5541853.1 hypothetical protein FYK55_16760 [Roseiconus nitratireducens]